MPREARRESDADADKVGVEREARSFGPPTEPGAARRSGPVVRAAPCGHEGTRCPPRCTRRAPARTRARAASLAPFYSLLVVSSRCRSVAAPSRALPVRVTFTIPFRCAFGDNMKVVGGGSG